MDKANEPSTRVIDILKWNKIRDDMVCVFYCSRPNDIRKEILLEIPVKDLSEEHLLQDCVDHSIDFEYNYIFFDIGHDLIYCTETYDYDWVSHELTEDDI